ncbi:MAG TPA: YkgJ family cysteine cluster protein [Candidatus Hydrogenedentes bacterium]|nr:YkgJ family cysteine cluster protein [Candidatus Hydrogenedentota bacterium]
MCLPTPKDVIRIARATGLHPKKFLEFLTPDEISEVSASDPTWLECDGQRYIMALRRGKKGCVFLKKKSRRCSIYEHRPILCRLYPLRIQEDRKGKFKGFTLHKSVGCPRYRDGVVEAAPLRKLYIEDCAHSDDYNDLVEAFNRDRDPAKKPKHFVKLFVKKI